jgi:hypothetical protein
MKLGYALISKADGSQTLDLQVDALAAAGVAPEHVYRDEASGKRDDRPGLEACLKALREGDTLFTWKLDRLGRDLNSPLTKSDFQLPVISTPATTIAASWPSTALIRPAATPALVRTTKMKAPRVSAASRGVP